MVVKGKQGQHLGAVFWALPACTGPPGLLSQIQKKGWLK